PRQGGRRTPWCRDRRRPGDGRQARLHGRGRSDRARQGPAVPRRVTEPATGLARLTPMRRILGTLMATAALAATAGCGSSTSSATAGPDSPSAGPITGAKVLPLISLTGGGGQVSTSPTLLDTPATVRAFTQQFR